MGAGGIRGELRDHSEHVDTILRSHFNVANTQTTSFSTSSRSGPHQQNSIINFNLTDGAFEEMACYSCNSNFSIFRRKNLCLKCKRCYCNDCFGKEIKFVPGENTSDCLTCRTLQHPVAYKDHLKKLKVRDLQDYLRAHEVSTSHCREKGELVELILQHARGATDTGNSTTATQNQARVQTQQTQAQTSSQRPMPERSNFAPPSNSQPVQVPQPAPMPASVGKSLSQIQKVEEVEQLSVKELKTILTANFVDFKGCCEKKELLDRVAALWKSKQKTEGKTSAMENGEEDSERCKICMDAIIDCVLLECGHMVTCKKCGKQLSDCPICRQNIARIVHVFRA